MLQHIFVKSHTRSPHALRISLSLPSPGGTQDRRAEHMNLIPMMHALQRTRRPKKKQGTLIVQRQPRDKKIFGTTNALVSPKYDAPLHFDVTPLRLRCSVGQYCI
jgi:hypothetical protein